MKKILLGIFLMINTLFSYSVEANIVKFYTQNNIIDELETRIPFEVEIWIDSQGRLEEDYFYLRVDNRNSYIKVENLSVESLNSKGIGNRYYFVQKNDRPLLRELKLRVKGNLIVNWREMYKDSTVVLGYIENNRVRRVKEPVYLRFDEEYLKKIYRLEIKVKDMNLGTGVAGYTLDTRTTGRPAIINVIGKKGEEVKISIPKTTKIRNKYGDTLDVKLFFEDRFEEEGDSWELSKELKRKNSESNRGETGDIFIHGICKTEEENIGKYEGNFIVRVTYED